jgi:hypothetical protein
MRWAGHIEHLGEMRNLYKLLVEEPERKRPLGTANRTREDIKINLKARV